MVKIAAVGDNVVDCYLAQNLMYPGGNCVNVSAYARRFGAHSAYVGAVSDDAAGRLIAFSLREEGVDASRLRIVPGHTAYCVIGHRHGDRVFLSSDLGVSTFEPSADDLAFLSGFDAVHVGQSSGLDRFVRDIAAVAPLSYDFSVRRDAAHREAIAPRCFLASFSGGDLRSEEREAIVKHLLTLGSSWVLVTLGQEGATLARAAETYHVTAAASRAVDTLGAGDTFIARVLVALLSGEAPQEALAAAAVASARTCEIFGAFGHAARLDVPVAKQTLDSLRV